MPLTWLHLSDLHACTPRFAWDADRVTETLVQDLRGLHRQHGLRPDLLFFTGDAAFGEIGTGPGETLGEQFACFATFLDQVRTAFDPPIELDDVFLVPGNHDVHRGLVMPEQTNWLDGQEDVEPVRSLIAGGGYRWDFYRKRLEAYGSFLEDQGFKHLLTDPERLIYATTREVDGLQVGIAGFNSAWSCCRDGERGRLWMAGRWQQGILRPELREADFSIALVHHPPDWLVEYETPGFGRGLEQEFRFLLHGHEHRDWVLHTADGYSVLAAGACYEHSESEHNGYNLVRLDPDQGRGEVWLRRFESTGGGWIPRVISGKTDDRGVFKLSLEWLRQKRLATPEGPEMPAASEDVVPAETEMPPETTASSVEATTDLDRYLQRLRAAHRDLPVSGFETRVRLPIQLDEVYIPLRARMVRGATDRDWKVYGASRELEMECGDESDVPFDQTLPLAAEHGLRGAVVLGDPGSGKSTLLKHFVLAATDPTIGPAALGLPRETVPVLIELRRLDDPKAGLRAAMEVTVASADIALDAAAFTQKLLERDHLLVLVDGLDEVADPASRESVSRWLEESLHHLPQSTFVVTSRYAGYRGDTRLSGRFLELHVRDVSEEAARRFIASWYGAVEAQADLGRDAEVAQALAREASEDLSQKIFAPEDQRISSLRSLAVNPLMLQILCLVHRDRKQLPERRVELYRECVLVLLELWRKAKGMPLDLDAPQALQLLRPLAYGLHVSERREAGLDELLPDLAKPLGEMRQPPEAGLALLEKIREQSGVLVSLGQLQYGFLHLSFQEYLCSLHVQDRFHQEPQVLVDLADHFGDPWWREVILLSLGLGSPSLFEPLMTEILNRGVLHRDVSLADDCLRDSLVSPPGPFLRALDQGVGESQERFHALRLLKTLSNWEDEEIRDGLTGLDLVKKLSRSDPDRQVRSMAVELLGGESEVESAEGPWIAGETMRERVHKKDGSVLVYVPGGEFTLGTHDDLEAYLEENRGWSKPAHRVTLSSFWIGKYPVTNAQYRRFLEENSGVKEPRYWEDKQFSEPQQPVVGVSWLEALAYCRWAGLDLPSEAQWEASARGFDARLYPWGNGEPTSELANFGSDVGRPSPVGAYPQGAGPFGTLDQAGNVWEWCFDQFEKNAYKNREGETDPLLQGDPTDPEALRVLRGGSWFGPALGLHSALRNGGGARNRSGDRGFRVVCRFGPEHGD